MGIYRNIQSACKTAGYNISVLEKELGLGRGSIAKWDSHVPSVRKMQAVAQTLHTTVEALLHDVEWEE